jgi:hypothetical protein
MMMSVRSLTKSYKSNAATSKEDMMKARWCIYLLIGFFSLAVLSGTISTVTGAQSRAADDDDEDALEDPLPSWVDLRVFIHRPRELRPKDLGTCVATASDNVEPVGKVKNARW